VKTSQSFDRESIEGVCEIMEALEAPAALNDTNRLLKVTSRIKAKQSELIELMAKAERIFMRRVGKCAHDFMFQRDNEANDLRDQLKTYLPKWPCVIYHGTSTKALSSILEAGLVVGFGKSRWKGVVNEDHLKQGVFVAENFKGAASFAQATALTKAGEFRKDGSRPVVIRMLAGDLNLQPDLRATGTGCWVSPVDIPIDAADASIVSWGTEGQGYDYPDWQPVDVIVDKYNPAHRLNAPTR
jgi:hypothetical protein